MRAIQFVTTRLSSCLRPIRFEFVSSSSPRLFSNTRRLICAAAATKSNGGRSGSIVAPLVNEKEEEEVQKIDVNPPKGTRDFAPEDMRLRNWLFNHFKEVCLLLKFARIFEILIPLILTDLIFEGIAVIWVRRSGLSSVGDGGFVHQKSRRGD